MKSFKEYTNNPILYHGTTSNFDFDKGLMAGGNKQTTSNFNASNGEIWLTSNREVAFEYAMIAWKTLQNFSLTPILIQVDIDVSLSADQPIEHDQVAFCFELDVIPKSKLKMVKLTQAELANFKKRYDRELKNGKSKFN